MKAAIFVILPCTDRSLFFYERGPTANAEAAGQDPIYKPGGGET